MICRIVFDVNYSYLNIHLCSCHTCCCVSIAKILHPPFFGYNMPPHINMHMGPRSFSAKIPRKFIRSHMLPLRKTQTQFAIVESGFGPCGLEFLK
jgi:hypothetical protein